MPELEFALAHYSMCWIAIGKLFFLAAGHPDGRWLLGKGMEE